MQVAKQKLGKRARYYHSQMDMDALGSGHEYNELLQIYSTVFSQMIIIYKPVNPFFEEKLADCAKNLRIMQRRLENSRKDANLLQIFFATYFILI